VIRSSSNAAANHGIEMTPTGISPPPEQPSGLVQRWTRWPLYLRILIAVALAVVTGLVLRQLGYEARFLEIPSKLVLQLLGALAPPLILLAVVKTLMEAYIPREKGARLVGLLVLNTLVAISIGLLVANVLQPGRWARLEAAGAAAAAPAERNLLQDLLDNVPKSLLGPLTDNGRIIGVVLIAIAFGLALRRASHERIGLVHDLVAILFEALILLLKWLIEVIPLAVFGIVASIIAGKGFGDFVALGAFVVAVLVALTLQATYYLARIGLGSWVRPLDALRGARDALVMAFSTASSTATMPVTYSALRDRIGLREDSASLGALVGANFNNDGTALYEAMSALFVSQLIGVELSLQEQLIVVLTSVVASVGAAGIPEAGLVTMYLVFTAVGLPVEYIAILLTVDWFLDRCRTAINVMGDINVSCLLDGKLRPTAESPVGEELPVVQTAQD
jgi:DAACS family dicarboxylate/amino acid:cation (Na+ or H+) symporter